MSSSIYFGAEKHVYHMTKEVLPWEQPGFIKHGENPSELMLQIEAEDLTDDYQWTTPQVWQWLSKKYPDCPHAQKKNKEAQKTYKESKNQATLAEFVGPLSPLDKPSKNIPKVTYPFGESGNSVEYQKLLDSPADKSYLKPKLQYYEVYVLSAANKYLYSKTLSDETWVDSPLQASHWLQLETAKDRIHYLTNKKFTKVFKLSIPILLEEVKEEVEEVITDDDVLI